jgi:hypothetical protein
MRAFNDIASATGHDDVRAKLLERAQRVASGCAGHLPKGELLKLQHRLKTFETSVAAEI